MTRPAVRFLDRKTPPHVMTLVLLTGLSAMAMNIFLPALPAMAAWFDADYWVMQLSVSLYLGLNALLQMVIGPLSDRFGRRPVMVWALVVFLVGTLGTLVAPTAEWFLICRMAQASVAAAMVLSRAVVRDIAAQDDAASMIGYITMGTAVVPMVGPLIGGVLAERFGWQSSFVLMLVSGLAMLALTLADMGETHPALRSGSGASRPRGTAQLLASPRFWGYCGASAFASGAFFAYLGGAPFLGTDLFHLSPSVLGFYFGAPALGYALGNYLSGRYSARFGVDRMVLAGTLVNLAGITLLIAIDLAGLAQAPLFFGLFSCIGLGNGLVLPNATAGMLSVRPSLAGTASGLGGAMMIGGGALLSALAGAVLVPGSGAMPMLAIMEVVSLAAVASILLVIRRARRLGL